MTQAHLALIGGFVRALLSEPGLSGTFSGLSLLDNCRTNKYTGAFSVDSPNSAMQAQTAQTKSLCYKRYQTHLFETGWTDFED